MSLPALAQQFELPLSSRLVRSKIRYEVSRRTIVIGDQSSQPRAHNNFASAHLAQIKFLVIHWVTL